MWFPYFLCSLVLTNALDIDDLVEGIPTNEDNTNENIKTAHLEPKLDIYVLRDFANREWDEIEMSDNHREEADLDWNSSPPNDHKPWYLEPKELSQITHKKLAKEQKISSHENYEQKIKHKNNKKTQQNPIDVQKIMNNITVINEALEKLLKNYETLQKIYKYEEQSSFENMNFSTVPKTTTTSDPNAEIRTGMFFDEPEEVTTEQSKETKKTKKTKNKNRKKKRNKVQKRSKVNDLDSDTDSDDDDVLTIPLTHKSEITFLKKHHSDDKAPKTDFKKIIFSSNAADNEDSDSSVEIIDGDALKSIVTGNAIVNDMLKGNGTSDRRYIGRITDANFAMSLVLDPKNGIEKELFNYSKHLDQSDPTNSEYPQRRFHEAHQRTLSLRDALGSACMKVYIRKCYKVIRSVQVDVCTSKKVCNADFKKKLDHEARTQCIKTFESTDEPAKKNVINNDGEVIQNRAHDDDTDDETRSGTETIIKALRGLLSIRSERGLRRNTHIHSLCFLDNSELNAAEDIVEPEPGSARSRVESLLLSYKIKRMTQGQNNDWDENARTNQETNIRFGGNLVTNPETYIRLGENPVTNPETYLRQGKNPRTNQEKARTNTDAYKNKHESFNQPYKTALTSSLQSLRGRYEEECRKAAAAKCMDACTAAFLEACKGVCEPYSKIMYKHGKYCHKHCQDMFLYGNKDDSGSSSGSGSSSSDSSSSSSD